MMMAPSTPRRTRVEDRGKETSKKATTKKKVARKVIAESDADSDAADCDSTAAILPGTGAEKGKRVWTREPLEADTDMTEVVDHFCSSDGKVVKESEVPKGDVIEGCPKGGKKKGCNFCANMFDEEFYMSRGHIYCTHCGKKLVGPPTSRPLAMRLLNP